MQLIFRTFRSSGRVKETITRAGLANRETLRAKLANYLGKEGLRKTVAAHKNHTLTFNAK